MATLIVEPSGHVLYWNDAGRRSFCGNSRTSELGELSIGAWYPPGKPLTVALEQIASSSNWLPLRLIRGGETVHLRARGLSPQAGGRAVLMTAAPEMSQAFLSHTLKIERLHEEIFQRKKLEEKLRAALETSELLKRELIHRVKNNLAVMSALLRSEARALDDPSTSSVLMEASSRIMSISVVHELLDESGEVDRIDVGKLITKLVARIQSAICPSGVSISLSTVPVLASNEAALPIALLVNELVTNAIKHAFPNNDQGAIEVIFRIDADGYELIVSDNGIGMPQLADGAIKIPRIVKALASQVDAKITCDTSNGSEWSLAIPSSAISPA